jgi:hypothetical protein
VLALEQKFKILATFSNLKNQLQLRKKLWSYLGAVIMGSNKIANLTIGKEILVLQKFLSFLIFSCNDNCSIFRTFRGSPTVSLVQFVKYFPLYTCIAISFMVVFL